MKGPEPTGSRFKSTNENLSLETSVQRCFGNIPKVSLFRKGA